MELPGAHPPALSEVTDPPQDLDFARAQQFFRPGIQILRQISFVAGSVGTFDAIRLELMRLTERDGSIRLKCVAKRYGE